MNKDPFENKDSEAQKMVEEARRVCLQECFDSAHVAKDTQQLKGWIKEELQALTDNTKHP